jgi:S1-C subfamily serine protease
VRLDFLEIVLNALGSHRVKPATVKPFLSRSTFALIALWVVFSAGATAARAAMSSGFNRLLDAVVRIDVRELAFEAGAKRYASSIGSGVILSSDGLILTNAHVVSRRASPRNSGRCWK